MAYARVRHRRIALGAAVDVAAPELGRPQAPIFPLQVGSHGAWLEVRASPADGACGVSGYPCRHPGVDVAGGAGTPVVAPESGVIVATGDGSAAPFVGYGPWFVVLQGQDSGKFHLLGHLEPMTSALGQLGAQFLAGQQIGTTSAANHTHWEVRSRLSPDFGAGEDNFTNNVDPIGWLSAAALGLGAVLVVGGAVLFFLLLRRRS